MAGRGYAVFDTAIGRCGIVWSDAGISSVQLPEAREMETRRRLYRCFPDARELRPPETVEATIEGIVAALNGRTSDFSDVMLDMTGIGLTPPDPISVAPSGIPVPPTGALGTMPSGEVDESEGVGITAACCAKAWPHSKTEAAVIIRKRFMVFLRFWVGQRDEQAGRRVVRRD